jgi:hypothetical protein
MALVTTAAYLALAFAGADMSGGKSLGRGALPLLPLLVVALATLSAYLSAASALDRWIGRAGAFVVMSAVMHLAGNVPATSSGIAAIRRSRRSPAGTASLRQTMRSRSCCFCHRKIVFLVDSPDAAQRLPRR